MEGMTTRDGLIAMAVIVGLYIFCCAFHLFLYCIVVALKVIGRVC